MAIAVLVLWLFTAGAGFSLLATSNLGRTRPAATAPAAAPATAAPATAAPATAAPATAAPATAAPATAAPATAAPATAAPATAAPATAAPATASVATPAQPASTPAQPASTPAQPAARRQSRAARDRFAPPSLVAARNAPVLPGLRSLLEFAHPACAIIGLGFWLGYTLVHYRPLGWIAFGLVTVTACLGLSWFAANTRAARRQHQDGQHQDGQHQDGQHQDGQHQDGQHQDGQHRAGPSFSTRLIAVHGGAAAVTVTLAALTALVLGH